jgi:hypothetical protein
MMTKAHAILSAYTGFMLGDFSDMHEYIEEVLDRSVGTHEMANEDLWVQIKQKIKDRGDLNRAIEAVASIDVVTHDLSDQQGATSER